MAREKKLVEDVYKRQRLPILRRRCGAGECESVGATPNRGSVNRNDMEKTLEF